MLVIFSFIGYLLRKAAPFSVIEFPLLSAGRKLPNANFCHVSDDAASGRGCVKTFSSAAEAQIQAEKFVPTQNPYLLSRDKTQISPSLAHFNFGSAFLYAFHIG